MKKAIDAKILSTVIFLGIIAMFFILNATNLWGLFKLEIRALFKTEYREEFLLPNEIEATYDNEFFSKMSFIEINGAARSLIGQKLVNGTIRANNDKLFLESDADYAFDEALEEKASQKAINIIDFAKKQGAKVLYVQHPMKYISGVDKLPYGLQIEYDVQDDYWCERFVESGIPVLDLRESLGDNLEFYKTDHHWTVESSFYAAKDIVEKLNENGTLEYNTGAFDIENFDIEHYEKAFLGSEGVKTGKYYVGKDDFNILVPNDRYSYSYQHYVDGEKQTDKEGSFKECFVDEELLKDGDYNNKYNACIYGGYVENIIHSSNNSGKKLLLISDSFARPMVPYLASTFSEIRYLDPQVGRYNDSYIEYIKTYKPDIVVMMYTGDFVRE